jgi:hypothetical protein
MPAGELGLSPQTFCQNASQMYGEDAFFDSFMSNR